ncbi:MAG: CCA tRNA nucleotidyltransferase [Candidatus Pacebacteria bacterium]|nr:CCA tRNA nucleotidyltransferase [Candidatus Paceibacterota bacterium]
MLPKYIREILQTLEEQGFEAYVVGGCVRDILMKKTPNDWDITTNAVPEEILDIFSLAKYQNDFGTVILPIKENDKLVDVVEITTYRSESGYSDRRRPDEVNFEKQLDKDLERRDFTINALAMDNSEQIVDLFGGVKDIKKQILRAVGEPIERFKEDSLRMLRAVRLSAQLGFEMEAKTERAILKMVGGLKFISKERVRDELIKMLKTSQPEQAILKLHKNKLLQYIIPELEQGVGVKQNHHHIYTVFDHAWRSLANCPSSDWRVKLAALLHDIGKPKSRQIIDGKVTFYNHEYIGAKISDKILTRLKFKNEDREKVVGLIRNHMFYYNVDEVTAASVRRLIKKVGQENLKDLIDLRIADRLGSGTPKAKPYKLRHLEYMMEKVQNDPVSVKMLEINGDNLLKELKLEPGPKVGAILEVLLSKVIDNPNLNKKDELLSLAKELKDTPLESLRKQAREVISEKNQELDKKIKKEFHV